MYQCVLKISQRRLSLFDCVQLAIVGRGHVTQHMKGSTEHNQNNNNFRKARQIQSGLNHAGMLRIHM